MIAKAEHCCSSETSGPDALRDFMKAAAIPERYKVLNGLFQFVGE
jgi:hypothetical protein